MRKLQGHSPVENVLYRADRSVYLPQNKYYPVILLLITIFALSGCGKWVNAVPSTMNNNVNSPDYVKKYQLKKTHAAFVGQQMLMVNVYNVVAENRINKMATPQKDAVITGRDKFRIYTIHIKAGTVYPIEHTLTSGTEIYYLAQVIDANQYRWGVLINADGSMNNQALYSYDFQLLFYPYQMQATPCVFRLTQGRSTLIKENTSAKNSYEIIYSGKNDVSLNLLYREYTKDDLARPAFSQHLTYQANAKQIRFQGFVIQVHNATNEQITYTILEDGLHSVFED
jgi:hypothetical protein